MEASSQVASVKLLALRVLREIAAQGVNRGACPAATGDGIQTARQDLNHLDTRPKAKAHCVEKYRVWLERWEARGRVQ
jgi:hypothetical protein